MGLRFRKSFGSGPFRVNLSKSGVSYSVGTKGARVTKKANGGIRTSVGTNGVYCTKDFGGSSVSKKRKAKKKSGCLTWVAGFIGVLAVFGITLGACSPEEPETKIPEEAPAIVEEQEQTPEVVEEQETPAEKEVIEFEPVFVDPYSGERTDEERTEQTPQEQPIEQEPVVVEPDPQGQIVYITNTGTKYHRAGCRYLKESCIETTLERAENNHMEACKVCH